MTSQLGQPISIWTKSVETPREQLLEENLRADVCVIGAGIAGMTTAYLLTREGKSVIVLDDGPIGGGETGQTTAHLANALDDRYFEIERIHGERGARLAADSHTAAIHQIQTVVEREKIECDFHRLDGYLFLAPGDARETLEREHDAARRAGLEVELLQAAPAGGLNEGPCLRFPRQGQFHPLRYLTGLSDAIERLGGRIFTRTRAAQVDPGRPARVLTESGYAVMADAVVVATNSPFNDRVAIHTKQAPYRTYVIGARVPRGSVPRSLYWDTGDPYHYVRLQSVPSDKDAEYDLLIVGGEDHKTGQARDGAERYARLVGWARQRYPMMETIEFRWSGQVMETVDGLAFIGRNPLDDDNIFIITGDSGMGMTHGTLGGMLITDLVMGRANPWADLYDPSRVPAGAVGEYARENLNVAAQYTDYLTGGDVRSTDEIASGTGAIIRRGLTKVAAYRDPDGVLHEYSAVCTHLGCIVDWNDEAKSWDCPCHGSRYDPYGRVINGPANADLAPGNSGEWGVGSGE